jgi:hypothetical protein
VRNNMKKVPLAYKLITTIGFGFLLFFILSGDNFIFFNKNKHNYDDPQFKLQPIFLGQRLPNIIVDLGETVVAT